MDCPYCHDSVDVHPKGSRTLKNGDVVHKYVCHHCRKHFTDRTGTALHGIRIPKDHAVSILRARSEGVGVRAAGRLTSHSHSTVIDLERRLQKATKHLEVTFPADFNAVFENDELYTRVHHNRPAHESPGWTALPIERHSRWWGATVTGRRDDELFTTYSLEVIGPMLNQPVVAIVSDGECRYAGGVYCWSQSQEWVGPEPRSRGRPQGTRKVWRKGLQVARKVKGSQGSKRRGRIERPGQLHPETKPLADKEIHANHCEAHNAAMRRRISAYRRRTNTYAKEQVHLDRAIAVQRLIHNWARPHWGHGGKLTPAMFLCCADHPWTAEELLMVRAA